MFSLLLIFYFSVDRFNILSLLLTYVISDFWIISFQSILRTWSENSLIKLLENLFIPAYFALTLVLTKERLSGMSKVFISKSIVELGKDLRVLYILPGYQGSKDFEKMNITCKVQNDESLWNWYNIWKVICVCECFIIEYFEYQINLGFQTIL